MRTVKNLSTIFFWMTALQDRVEAKEAEHGVAFNSRVGVYCNWSYSEGSSCNSFALAQARTSWRRHCLELSSTVGLRLLELLSLLLSSKWVDQLEWARVDRARHPYTYKLRQSQQKETEGNKRTHQSREVPLTVRSAHLYWSSLQVNRISVMVIHLS